MTVYEEASCVQDVIDAEGQSRLIWGRPRITVWSSVNLADVEAEHALPSDHVLWQDEENIQTRGQLPDKCGLVVESKHTRTLSPEPQ